MKNFWKDVKKPCFVLAPMADVTDASTRMMLARHGKPDVMWTEFVSADGLFHTREKLRTPDSENPLMLDLRYDEIERPIVAQLFTSNPETMEYASHLCMELGFDGVDINMGCPHKPVEKQNAGAALIKNPERARELIRSAKRGVEGKIPVSVKTRIGYSKNELNTWLPELLKEEPAVVTIHARTRKELSLVPARWEHVHEAVLIRNAMDLEGKVFILGNGDVTSMEDGIQKSVVSHADGVMVGRGIFGNPWFFSGYNASHEEKIQALKEHCELFTTLSPHKHFSIMKKHFKAYIQGFSNAKEVRMRLMESETAVDVIRILESVEIHTL